MQVGIDIGSRTIKVASVKEGKLQDFHVAESGFDPRGQSLEMIGKYRHSRVIATGYGRHLARGHFAGDVITEIKAHALGARYFSPACNTVLDVGGQDSKVISLNAHGKVVNFQMNDKCAAGTGRFLEIMAASLGYQLNEFGEAALNGSEAITIGSMCTVFAESEVISLKNRGHATQDIARAVHRSVVDRLAAMLHRIGYGAEVVFTGGVAKNPAIVRLLEERLGIRALVPSAPDIVGALGAALSADEEAL